VNQTPETHYAKSGDVSIAYQVLGSALIDLVFVHGFIQNLALVWDLPPLARYFRRLASFSRLILFDRRGVGLSDRVPTVPPLETRMDDIRAVMDAADSQRAAVFGSSEGGPTAALFAATYPERTTALIMYGTYARGSWAPDYPWADKPDAIERQLNEMAQSWGTQEYADRTAREVAPSLADDERFRRWMLDWMRLSASPAAAIALERMAIDVDVREVLPTIRVPTLILHKAEDQPEAARYMAARIPGAKYVELPGADHIAFVGTTDQIPDHIEEFLTGARTEPELDRVLATVLFTDIVKSTAKSAELGDRRYREVLEDHHAVVRNELQRFRGREVDTAGDGFFATFDGPARAVRCARAIVEAVRPLGIEIRAGCHTGEVEVVADAVRGIAVHIGSRVASLAMPGEVLVSQTVKDLVAGSGLVFEDAGEHELKGVPDRWRLYRVVG